MLSFLHGLKIRTQLGYRAVNTRELAQKVPNDRAKSGGSITRPPRITAKMVAMPIALHSDQRDPLPLLNSLVRIDLLQVDPTLFEECHYSTMYLNGPINGTIFNKSAVYSRFLLRFWPLLMVQDQLLLDHMVLDHL